MSHVPTPHNAAREGDIAPFVLMPGDPLRARYLAENYLEGVRCVNEVRNMLAFTGTYQGRPVTVMGSGMGMPSIGIYSYELFNFYGVEAIVRIGSSGGYADELNLKDVVAAQGACTDSNYASHFNLPGTYAPICDFGLLSQAVAAAHELEVPIHVGNVVASDAFYVDNSEALAWKGMGVLAVDMESAALYMNAAQAHKKALTLLTISDMPLTGEGLPADERETGFRQMMEVALNLVPGVE